jgi:hypothetical protein
MILAVETVRGHAAHGIEVGNRPNIHVEQDEEGRIGRCEKR